MRGSPEAGDNALRAELPEALGLMPRVEGSFKSSALAMLHRSRGWELGSSGRLHVEVYLRPQLLASSLFCSGDFQHLRQLEAPESLNLMHRLSRYLVLVHIGVLQPTSKSHIGSCFVTPRSHALLLN